MISSSDGRRRAERKTIGVNVRIRSTPVVLTPDLAQELIDGAAYISLARGCPCREERKCRDFPVDFGCLYLGEGARGIVAKGNALQIGRQEAREHIRRAGDLGLVHMVLWTSEELRSLGADAKKALELCSCCPCCCLNRRTGDGMKAYIDGITGMGIARAEGECNACGECEGACIFKCYYHCGGRPGDQSGPVQGVRTVRKSMQAGRAQCVFSGRGPLFFGRLGHDSGVGLR